MLIEQTHRKAEESMEFKMIKPRKTFHFNPPIQIKGDWMIELVSLELYNSIFDITEENIKFELCTGYLEDEFSYTQLKDKVAEVLGLSDITPEELEHEIFGPKYIEIYRKLSTEKSQTDGFYLLLRDYDQSPFRDFEIYLRIVVGLVEDDIQLILKQYNSKFTTYKISLGAYTFKDLSEVLSRGFKKNMKSEEEYDQIINMTNLIQLSSIVITFP